MPWRLIGESVLCWARVGRGSGSGPARVPLPDGVRRLPLLPAAIVAVRYESSPVGRYNELSVAVFARVGLRVGLCVVHSVVSSVEARAVYRSEWGLPTELGTLVWSDVAESPGLSWEERGVVVRAAPVGRFPVPVAVPVPSVQRLPDGLRVSVPRRLWGFLRFARVDVSVAPSAAESAVPLAWLAGSHPGAVLTSMRVVASPVRVLSRFTVLAPAEPSPPGLAVE